MSTLDIPPCLRLPWYQQGSICDLHVSNRPIESFENKKLKGVIRSHKSMKERQYHGQKKNDKQ